MSVGYSRTRDDGRVNTRRCTVRTARQQNRCKKYLGSVCEILLSLMLLALGNRLHASVVDWCGRSPLHGARVVSIARNTNVPVLFQMKLDVSGLQHSALPMLCQAASELSHIFDKLVDMLLQKLFRKVNPIYRHDSKCQYGIAQLCWTLHAATSCSFTNEPPK